MIKKGIVKAKKYYTTEGYVNYSLIKRVADSGNRAFIKQNAIKAIRSKKMFDAGHAFEKYFLEDKDLSYIQIDKTENLSPHGKILFEYLLEYCKKNKISDASTIPQGDIILIIHDLSIWSHIKQYSILLKRSEDAIEKTNFYLSLNEDSVIGTMEIFDTMVKMDEGMKKYEEVYNALYPQTDNKLKIYNQYTIFDDESFKVPVKGRLDRVIIDSTEKTVSIIDFKSMEAPVDKFMKSFYTFKYYYQLPFYTTLFMKANPRYKNYKYEMKFVVVSKSFPSIPAVYILPNTWIDKAWEGWKSNAGYPVKGIHFIIEEIEYYWMAGSACPYNLAYNHNVLTIENDWN